MAMAAAGALSLFAELKADYQVVPMPQSIVENVTAGSFTLTPEVKVLYPEGNKVMKRNAELLADYISDNLGFTPATGSYDPSKLKKGAGNGAIVLALDPKVENEEGYELTVGPKGVTIKGSGEAGVFYGIQTLRKSLPVTAPAETATEVTLPAVTVTDAPRFRYRGMLLDTGRHYYPVEGVKRFVDLMAMHNMNNFHWHITDDQGWRIELKRHPELTEKGSTRKETIFGRVAPVYDNTPYGGYYTQDDIREILQYCADRHINVIPEIDMPGHTLSLLASHPEVGCTGGPYEVGTHWGVYPDILCAGKEATFKLVEEIWDEVLELFPSEYVNIGGDEAPKVNWEKCPDCQRRIAEEGITAKDGYSAESQLQGYFTKRLEKYLNSKGRKVIGWDEITEADINPSTTVMAWRGTDHIASSANAGHDVIGASNSYNYLDYYQRQNTFEEPFLIGHYLPLSKVYQYEPVSDEVLPGNEDHIIGVQAALWGEFIGNANLMTYQALPRMAAVSESQWIAPDKKVYSRFLPRLRNLTHLYDRYQYPWCRAWE